MTRFSDFLLNSGISTLVTLIVARSSIPIDSQAKITMSIVKAAIHMISVLTFDLCLKNMRFYRVISDVPIVCHHKTKQALFHVELNGAREQDSCYEILTRSYPPRWK